MSLYSRLISASWDVEDLRAALAAAAAAANLVDPSPADLKMLSTLAEADDAVIKLAAQLENAADEIKFVQAAGGSEDWKDS